MTDRNCQNVVLNSVASIDALSLQGVHSGYGKKEILSGISMSVQQGTIVALIGPNGSGKSTLLKTIFGLITPWSGVIQFQERPCSGLSPSTLISRGLVYVPQGNRVFPELTVQENLTVSQRGMRSEEIRKRLEKMISLFPALKEFLGKRASALSGGERQQVALATGLFKEPRMLLLDEPSLGLAPNVQSEVFESLKRINEELGVTILIVEHKVREVFRIADSVLGLRRGQIVDTDKPINFDQGRLQSLFLG